MGFTDLYVREQGTQKSSFSKKDLNFNSSIKKVDACFPSLIKVISFRLDQRRGVLVLRH